MLQKVTYGSSVPLEFNQYNPSAAESSLIKISSHVLPGTDLCEPKDTVRQKQKKQKKNKEDRSRFKHNTYTFF